MCLGERGGTEEVKLSLLDLAWKLFFNHVSAQKAKPFSLPPPRVVSFAQQLSLTSVHTRPQNKKKQGFEAFRATRAQGDRRPLGVLTMHHRRVAKAGHLRQVRAQRAGHGCQPTLQGRATPTRLGAGAHAGRTTRNR